MSIAPAMPRRLAWADQDLTIRGTIRAGLLIIHGELPACPADHRCLRRMK